MFADKNVTNCNENLKCAQAIQYIIASVIFRRWLNTVIVRNVPKFRL